MIDGSWYAPPPAVAAAVAAGDGRRHRQAYGDGIMIAIDHVALPILPAGYDESLVVDDARVMTAKSALDVFETWASPALMADAASVAGDVAVSMTRIRGADKDDEMVMMQHHHQEQDHHRDQDQLRAPPLPWWANDFLMFLFLLLLLFLLELWACASRNWRVIDGGSCAAEGDHRYRCTYGDGLIGIDYAFEMCASPAAVMMMMMMMMMADSASVAGGA